MATTKRIKLVLKWCALIFLLFPLRASADSYDVTASIPFPAPTIAAVIDSSFEGRGVSSDVLELFGTCEHIYPTSIVSIWRTGVLLGSVNCEANGTFRLNVTLTDGANTFIARTSSLSENYGPDSAAVTVTYTRPVADPGQPASPSESSLELTSPMPFVTLNDENAVTIQITVGGGLGPYTIVINWGDGSTETLLVDDPGTFSFDHVYTDPGIYKVVATVTDILGVSKVYQFIVASTKPPAADANTEKPQQVVVEEKNNTPWLLISLGGVLLALLILLSSFLLGRRYQFKKMQQRITELEELSKKHNL